MTPSCFASSCSRAFSTGPRAGPPSAVISAISFSSKRAVGGRIDREEADTDSRREQRNSKHAVDPGFRELAANAREQVESFGRRHDQCLPAAERAEREREQAIRDAGMRAGEAAAGDRLQPSPIQQIDGDALDARSSAIRSTAVSSVWESESCAIAWLMTVRSARERSSSACVSTKASFARSAWAARTPKVASGPPTSVQRLGPALEDELEDTERRLAEPDARD